METNFNWYTELNKAIRNEPVYEQTRLLLILSANWVTCACGQLCKDIPKELGSNEPVDYQLSFYGNKFHQLIRDYQWAEALTVLDDIEQRTAELLQEINTKQNKSN